jgi:exodeoxyribonuclease V beta subunit
VFVQDIGGEKRYSILDWKTNLLPAYDERTVEKEVHEEYPIQLVLYSYCLVQWLCCIYKEKSLEEAFNKYFGGAYYVFVRGCQAGTGKGIYAHIWKDFNELQERYNKVKGLMLS